MDSGNIKICVSAAVVGWFAWKQFSGFISKSKVRSKINAFREEAEDRKKEIKAQIFQKGQPRLNAERRNIISLPLGELLEKLKNDQLKPVQVLEAYQASAIEVTEKLNCVCSFIVEARQWALQLEDTPASERGPLHGLPISIKESLTIKGYCQTVGLSRFIGQPAEEHGVSVAFMISLGAIPFCQTNVPQTMKSFSCSNPIYGQTKNPYDPLRTPGGSSGGESCLIAAGGSPLGIGTDAGGSVRIPAVFCGIVALKPTTGRILTQGRRMGGRGCLIGVQSNSGFMAKSVEGVLLPMKILLDEPEKMAAVDNSVAPIPWNETIFNPKRKLRIGWYNSDSVFPSIPACRRAVELCRAKLSSSGHTLVAFEPPFFHRLQQLYFHESLADGGQLTLDLLQGDLIDQSIQINMLVWKLHPFIRKTLLRFITSLRSPMLGEITALGALQSADLWRALEEQADLRRQILESWDKLELDAVIGPGFAMVAPPHDLPSKVIVASSVTGVYNQLDFPVGTLPVTRVTSQDEELLESSYPRDDHLFRLVHQGMKGSTGLPAGVQVIGKPFQEERVLALMAEIEAAVQEKFQPKRF